MAPQLSDRHAIGNDPGQAVLVVLQVALSVGGVLGRRPTPSLLAAGGHVHCEGSRQTRG